VGSQRPAGVREKNAAKLSSILVVLLAALVAAVSATAATPTRRSWATAANAACSAVNAKVRRLPTVTSSQVWVSDTRAMLRMAPSFDAKLAAIPRPSNERAAIASLLAMGQTQERLLRGAIPAMERGDQAALSALVTKNETLTNKYNRIALALGAWVCAENPVPSG
jgi:hypothetical protein